MTTLEHELSNELTKLNISEDATPENPWASKAATPVNELVSKAEDVAPPPAATPVFERAMTPPALDPNVLSDFDPLVDKEEKEAREAWVAAESHPPPQPPAKEAKAEESAKDESQEIDAPPLPSLRHKQTTSVDYSADGPSSASSFTTVFPAFANIARSLAGQGTRNDVNRSGVEVLPSPTTLASMAKKQATAAAEETPKPASGSGKSPSKSTEPLFDFQRFLDQLKTRSAEPIAKYFRSFLGHFSKRTFTVNDQVKLVNQFLIFIEPRMRECDVWKRETDEEFENSMEAMEKLVMNRVYDFTFTPQIASLGHKVTADDLERDQVLSQRIRLFKWIEEKHLDVPTGDNNAGFLGFAQQELLKINHYKAPRDKIICILNCCKVIFGLIRHLKKDEGADAFIPILILVVIRANPDHLLSNVEYIQRFRSPQKLQSEAGYYLSSLMGAVSFIETMDHTSLSKITQEEFESYVEEAIQNLPPSPMHTRSSSSSDTPTAETEPEPPKTPSAPPTTGEEAARPLQLPTPASIAEDTRKFFQRTSDLAQQTISKPLNAIGRIFSDALDTIEDDQREWSHSDQRAQYQEHQQHQYPNENVYRTPARTGENAPPPIQTPYKPRVRPVSTPGTPSAPGARTPESVARMQQQSGGGGGLFQPNFIGSLPAGLNFFPSGGSPFATPQRGPTPVPATHPGYTSEFVPAGHNAEERGIMEEIGAIDQAHRESARTTVKQMFPQVEDDVIDMILEANDGDLGRTIEAMIDIADGS